MKSGILALTITLALSQLAGCAAAVVGGAAAGGYYVAKDERSLSTITADATITSKVKTKLIKDKHIQALDINVDTYEGVVTLHGNVPSDNIKERAIQLASSVKGVKKIVTKLVIVPPINKS